MFSFFVITFLCLFCSVLLRACRVMGDRAFAAAVVKEIQNDKQVKVGK